MQTHRPTLRDRLRTETGPAHRAAESAADLPWRLAASARYAGLLLELEAVHRVCEPALLDLLGSDAPGLLPGWRLRRARLRADLDALVPGVSIPAVAIPALPTRDHALGALYVFEGSALGGRVIALQARLRLPGVTGALSYLDGDGAATAQRWRAVQALLSGWTPQVAEGADRAVRGAHATFTALHAQLALRTVP